MEGCNLLQETSESQSTMRATALVSPILMKSTLTYPNHGVRPSCTALFLAMVWSHVSGIAPPIYKLTMFCLLYDLSSVFYELSLSMAWQADVQTSDQGCGSEFDEHGGLRDCPVQSIWEMKRGKDADW